MKYDMNKYDLITLLASKENLTEVNATRIVNLIFDGFKDALVKGDRIEIRWFGSFVVREYRSYAGRNPKQGVQPFPLLLKYQTPVLRPE